MTLSTPSFLKMAPIQDNSIRYKWDEWSDLPVLETVDEDLVAQLKKVSQRAVLAFACGTAEWIVYRFEKLCHDPAPNNYLVAAWAMIVNVRYCGYGRATEWKVFSKQGWDGPIRGPICESLLFLEAALQEVAWNNTEPVGCAGGIAALACYLINDPAPYRRWREQVLERFCSLYPRNREDPLGDVVPREAVDPEFNFRVEQTPALINAFLSRLDCHVNVFLSPPEGMLQHFEDGEDFHGKPYAFDIEIDRQARRDRKTRGQHH
jgi:hypothetical protein